MDPSQRPPQKDSIRNIWHDKIIEKTSLVLLNRLAGHVDVVSHKHWPGKKLIAKYSRNDTIPASIDDETLAYYWLQGHDICPEFLAHIKDGDRVVGLLLTMIAGREAKGLVDLHKCQSVLKKLHDLKIIHGDMYHGNLLVTKERAWLIDLEVTKRNTSQRAIEDEMEALEYALQDAEDLMRDPEPDG